MASKPRLLPVYGYKKLVALLDQIALHPYAADVTPRWARLYTRFFGALTFVGLFCAAAFFIGFVRRRLSYEALAFSFPLITLFFYVPMHPEARYAFPAVPLLIASTVAKLGAAIARGGRTMSAHLILAGVAATTFLAQTHSWDLEDPVLPLIEGRQPPPIPKPGLLAGPKSDHQVGLPIARTRAAIPADNPQSLEKVALGEKLFFDGRLSADGTVACSTCHNPALAFTDGRLTSMGIKGRVGQRNAPTILNALYNETQFWDGRVNTLEEQAVLPITNSIEMGQPSLDAAVARITKIEEYQKGFQSIFGRAPNGTDMLRAIASYERSQFSFDSPFDHFIAGDKNAISESAKRGWEILILVAAAANATPYRKPRAIQQLSPTMNSTT